jgi:hypothetical protein
MHTSSNVCDHSYCHALTTLAHFAFVICCLCMQADGELVLIDNGNISGYKYIFSTYTNVVGSEMRVNNDGTFGVYSGNICHWISSAELSWGSVHAPPYKMQSANKLFELQFTGNLSIVNTKTKAVVWTSGTAAVGEIYLRFEVNYYTLTMYLSILSRTESLKFDYNHTNVQHSQQTENLLTLTACTMFVYHHAQGDLGYLRITTNKDSSLINPDPSSVIWQTTQDPKLAWTNPTVDRNDDTKRRGDYAILQDNGQLCVYSWIPHQTKLPLKRGKPVWCSTLPTLPPTVAPTRGNQPSCYCVSD